MALASVEPEPEKKRSGLILMVAAVASLSIVGAGAGWLVGGILVPPPAVPEEAAPATAQAGHGAAGKEGEIPNVSDRPEIVRIDPIVTNLAYPSEDWIRVELALVFNGAPDANLAEEIHQEVLAYLRTVSLQQIQGPRGFQYLRDDISEIADMRSQGRISKVLFRSFIVE
ncbi:MAG TPA: flagellar basal body-associated FliL family protein [Rhizobium sp.]|nr:flagellar basal body-associated FliL family protein [Rhizobium sp.]